MPEQHDHRKDTYDHTARVHRTHVPPPPGYSAGPPITPGEYAPVTASAEPLDLDAFEDRWSEEALIPSVEMFGLVRELRTCRAGRETAEASVVRVRELAATFTGTGAPIAWAILGALRGED